MEDRFRSLYQLKQELYTEDAPLIIEKGSLLQDMQTNALVIQLKFHSITQKTFKALKVRINTYDVSHILLPEVIEYQYLDMSITNGEKFGSNKAILVKNSVVRSFEIKEYSVVYWDNTVKTVQSPFEMLPLSKTLKQEFSNDELEKQYRVETTDQAIYVPIRYDNLWNCTCGEWNKDNICSNCKAKEEIVFKRFNIKLLTEHMEKRLAEEKIIQEREAKLAAEEEKRLEEVRKIELAKKQKRTKIGLCAAGIIAVVLIFVYKIYPNFIEPSMSYNHAKKMLSEKKYDDAVAEFEKLGSYKDAEDMVLQAKYNYAKQLVSNKKYDDAISIFEELKDYKDSEDMIKKATYEKANDLLKNGDYKKAKDIFESLGNQEMVVETIFQEVSNLITEKKYDKARNELRWCPYSIKKNNDNLKELTYQLADAYMNEEEYQSASEIFKDISDYKDSLSKWGKCQIQLGKHYMSKKQNTEAIRRFERVLKEDTTPENIKEANEQIKKCEEEVNSNKLENIFKNIKFGVTPEVIEKQFGKPDDINSSGEKKSKYEEAKYTYKDCCELDGITGNLTFIFKHSDNTNSLKLTLVNWNSYNEDITYEVYEKILSYLNNVWGTATNQENSKYGWSGTNGIDYFYYLIRDTWNKKNYRTYFCRSEEDETVKECFLGIYADSK